MTLHDTSTTERAVLAQVVYGRRDLAEAADSLLELSNLADTAGYQVVGKVTQRRQKIDSATLMGSGKVADLRTAAEAAGADVVLFDNELNSIQAHNLQRALGVRVADRTEVILQIFAGRARSAEAQAQVELAQLQFMLSRIPVLAEQQRFKGGIGMKGPGESRLHLRNKPIRNRITELKRQLIEIQARQKRARDKRRWPVVTLVGYTNAGKSSLLNLLAGADAYVDDRLFATLDTKTRMIWLGAGRQVLLADTVGFVRNLPHDLIASFRSTLNVAVQADLLLLVVDASHQQVRDHIEVCKRTLTEIGADHIPLLLVLNKCDALDADKFLDHAASDFPQAIPISVKTGYGIDTLKLAIVEELRKCCILWQLPSATSAI